MVTKSTSESSGYERWTALVNLKPRMDRRSLILLALVVAAASVGLAILASTRPSGLVAGILAAVTGLTLLFTYVIVWVEITGRAHWALLRRVGWNDSERLLLFFGAFVGFPIVTIGPILLVILVMTAG